MSDSFACAVIKSNEEIVENEGAEFKVWGTEIDPNTIEQMKQAMKAQGVVAGVLCPDAHFCRGGVPVGSNLATDNNILVGAVGYDISCQMAMSVLPISPDALIKNKAVFVNAIEKGSKFGYDTWYNKKYHEVMDDNWNITPITKNLKDLAWQQLGSSGSSNHFCLFGVLTLEQDDLGLQKGQYVALLSHSGSRGSGHKICTYYLKRAQALLSRKLRETQPDLAGLDFDSNDGQEYWLSMQLMGKYASANHAVLHREIAHLVGEKPLMYIENKHNYAWQEIHNGKKLIVHRKGATPAKLSEISLIPGSQKSPAFVVRGKGNPDSLMSASHGAGRRMSRTQAKNTFTWHQIQKELDELGITLIGGGVDECGDAYKDIHKVMAQQADLVEIVARLDPKIVRMDAEINGKRARVQN